MPLRRSALILAAGVPVTAYAQPVSQSGLYCNVTAQGFILELVPVDIADKAQSTGMFAAPEGAKVQIFVRDRSDPRLPDVSDAGICNATRRSAGDMIMLKEEDGNGRTKAPVTVARRTGMHGIAHDIPASVTALHKGMPTEASLPDPAEIKQGTNSTRDSGPNLPQADGPHYSHFQIFALDVPTLSLDPAADRAAVLDALRGHVLAKGGIAETYTL